MSFTCNNFGYIQYSLVTIFVFIRYNLLSMAKLRTELLIQKFNLTNTVESLQADPAPVFLKYKRKSFVICQVGGYKTTENIEFLKEVIIKYFIDVFSTIIK